MNRRELFKMFSALGASQVLPGNIALSDSASPAKVTPFVLYLHFGSACGANSGLVQPLKKGSWPTGHFQEGNAAGSNNPLINQHYQEGNLIFHDYNQFMADIADNMCLVTGNPQNLDHTVAYALQKCGNPSFASSPGWAMGASQNSKTALYPNPMFIGSVPKSISVPDVSVVQADNFSKFQTITRDVEGLPRNIKDPMINSLIKRFSKVNLPATNIEKEFSSSAQNNLTTLAEGIPALNQVQGDVDTLNDMLSKKRVESLVSKCQDLNAIIAEATDGFRANLVLAGILAKTGIAAGMDIDLMGEDTHTTGSDFTTPRIAAGRWALINLFWKWCKSAGIADKVLIIVGQEFGRSPYNTNGVDVEIMTKDGKKSFRSPGRDHGLHMGTMFINSKVPSSGRVGIVSDNLSPVAGKDTKGTPNKEEGAYTIDRVVGSMFMRVYPEIFPDEASVKKHWSNFKVIAPIVA